VVTAAAAAAAVAAAATPSTTATAAASAAATATARSATAAATSAAAATAATMQVSLELKVLAEARLGDGAFDTQWRRQLLHYLDELRIEVLELHRAQTVAVPPGVARWWVAGIVQHR
jgi:hypothetical protein